MPLNAETIKSLLDEGGIDYKANSKSFILTCPRCQKRGKLYIRKYDGRFVCWVCRDSEGFSGAPEWVFAELLGRSVSEIRKQLYDDDDDGTPRELFLHIKLIDFFGENDEVPLSFEELPEIEPNPDFRPLAGTAGQVYLENRGVPLDVAQAYGIMYWPAKKRIVFPVVSQSRLLGWQDRYIEKTEYFDDELGIMVKVPKAMTSTDLKRDSVLMFSDRINSDHAILCEGPIDAIKAHLCGGNVASMGKAVSRQQLALLKHSGIRKLYLALDPDAFIEASKILNEMVDEMEVYDMRPPSPYKDLGEMTIEQVYELFKRAPRVDRTYLFLYLKEHYAGKSVSA